MLLETKGVNKNFGSVHALQNVNLKIMQGEITTLMGPSGSGKTTLLRIFAGLESPTEGIILYDDNLITSSNRHILRQKATMVFQKSVFFNTTVHENIAYGLKVKDYPKNEIKEKVKEALELVRLEGFEKRPAKKLSGGEQQRVSLARALVLNTEILLLDEPAVNIDPKNVSIIEETISRVNRDNKTTIILATHNMFQAELLSKRVVLLLEGTMKQTGTNREIFDATNRYLESFSRLENIFSGISKLSKDGNSFIDIGQNIRIIASIKRLGKVIIYVSPEDILVSTKPLNSSARNVLEGKITRIMDLGTIARLTVDVGKYFIIQVTKQSITDMQLNVGLPVFITFKASSVQLI